MTANCVENDKFEIENYDFGLMNLTSKNVILASKNLTSKIMILRSKIVEFEPPLTARARLVFLTFGANIIMEDWEKELDISSDDSSAEDIVEELTREIKNLKIDDEKSPKTSVKKFNYPEGLTTKEMQERMIAKREARAVKELLGEELSSSEDEYERKIEIATDQRIKDPIESFKLISEKDYDNFGTFLSDRLKFYEGDETEFTSVILQLVTGVLSRLNVDNLDKLLRKYKEIRKKIQNLQSEEDRIKEYNNKCRNLKVKENPFNSVPVESAKNLHDFGVRVGERMASVKANHNQFRLLLLRILEFNIPRLTLEIENEIEDMIYEIIKEKNQEIFKF
eukprot:GHVP01041873.1.p1 GENE.GHVP01041873.1~~GHVP01041873.1.p1  ORF type:complete len:337 (-),score=78.46 GHVP01041873.1:356-1366(-)